MKGLSPLIAVMILLGVSITIGALLSGWITHWFHYKSGETNTCGFGVGYRIDSAEFNMTSYTLYVKVTNEEPSSIYGFGVILQNDTFSILINSSSWRMSFTPQISEDRPLEQGHSMYIILNLTGYEDLGMTLNKIIVVNSLCKDIQAETTNIEKIS